MCRVIALPLTVFLSAFVLFAAPPSLTLKGIVDASDQVLIAKILEIRPAGVTGWRLPQTGSGPAGLVECQVKVQVLYDLSANVPSVEYLTIDGQAVGSACDGDLPLNDLSEAIFFLKTDGARKILTTTWDTSILFTRPFGETDWRNIHGLTDRNERYAYVILSRWPPSELSKYFRLILWESLELQKLLGWRRSMKVASVYYTSTSGLGRDRLFLWVGVNGVCLYELQEFLRRKPVSGIEREFRLLDPEERSLFADDVLGAISAESRVDFERNVSPLDGYDLLHWYACLSIPEVAEKARGQLQSLYAVKAGSLVCPPCR